MHHIDIDIALLSTVTGGAGELDPGAGGRTAAPGIGGAVWDTGRSAGPANWSVPGPSRSAFGPWGAAAQPAQQPIGGGNVK